MDTDFYLYMRSEPIEDREEAVEGEAAKVGIADAREIGRGDAGQRMGGTDGQFPPIQHLGDFSGEGSLQLLNVSVCISEIAKDIAAAVNESRFFRVSSQHLLQLLQPALDQFDFVLRSFNALRRFFLERMNYSDISANLRGIHNPKSIPPKGMLALTPVEVAAS